LSSARRRALAAWGAGLVLAAVLAARAHYTADLSAFLPAAPTAAQQLLVEQLRDGPASHMILVAIGGGTPAQRAAVSQAMAQALRGDARLRSVNNGGASASGADQQFIFNHRYLLSDSVRPGYFAGTQLATALADGVDLLGSSAGLLLRDLFTRDPTGETLQVVSQYDRATRPAVSEGAWASRDGERALLLADTVASGSDTDGQAAAMQAVQAAFDSARTVHDGSASAPLTLRMTGPGVFAVESRELIKGEAERLSLLSTAVIVAFLLLIYRSPTVLLLGLLPVASGALAGVAAVASGFSVVHGVTLGFGVTLIGETVDYSIYLLIQGQHGSGTGRDDAAWLRGFWPTIRLGMLTSVVGFATLLPSSFPGLAQLGLYSIAGLVAAALVTRFVLPLLLPRTLRIRNVAPLGAAFLALAAALHRVRHLLWLVPVAGAAGLWLAHGRLWSIELSALNPVSREAQAFDARSRTDLGAPDVRTVVVVSGPTAETALEGAEDAGRALLPLVGEGALAGFDSPARYLPSERTQRLRQSALPPPEALRPALATAARGLPFDAAQLGGFIEDVAQAREAPLIHRSDLAGTSLATGVDAMLIPHAGGWSALLPLEAKAAGPGAFGVDLARVEAAVKPVAAGGTDVVVLDLKRESDALYGGYLGEAMKLSLAGLLAILLLLAFTLRAAGRVLRVVAPLALAVMAVLAGFAFSGQAMNILHLVGLLLIVAIGSNYALFFDSGAALGERAARERTVASLVVANLCTVAAFGVLALSSVPVLSAVGMTVAPGTLLALLFSAVLARPAAGEATPGG
jgi:predicted exporter